MTKRKPVLSVPAQSSIFCLLSSILAAALPGCVKQTKPPATISRAPLVVDEAMQMRVWPKSVVRFQNGETPAWPTGFVLEHNPKAPKWMPVATDGPLFVINMFALPIGYAWTTPWTPVVYPSGVVPPTYNAMPPLPQATTNNH